MQKSHYLNPLVINGLTMRPPTRLLRQGQTNMIDHTAGQVDAIQVKGSVPALAVECANWGTNMDRRVLLKKSSLLAGAVLSRRIFGAPQAASNTSPQARTTYGSIMGSVRDGIFTFKGIPYGAPTGGDARFLPPAKPAPWAGIRSALF